jgi:carbamoyltransferase
VHFDGTARIQTVSRRTNPSLYALIKRFANLTGVPVILNTSFNRREPIVQTPNEAVSCYLRTQMDALVVGNFYSCREKQHLLASDVGELQAAE